MNGIPIRHIHAALKEPDFSGSFIIRDVHDFLAGDDMVQELHRHDFFYLLVLKKGTGRHDIDFKSYTVCDHTIFFMRPGQVHQIILKAGSTGYLMQFREEYYRTHNHISNQLLHKAGSINYYQLDTQLFQQVLGLLDAIFREYTDKQERYQDVIKANMDVLFIALARQHTSPSPDHGSLYVQEQLEAFLDLLETHVVNHKQVSQYAAMLHLSSYQLNAITKTTVGKTCSTLINEYIILEAKRYLLATADQVNQIADHLGYEDVSYFIRFFKKHTGYTPEAFRHDFK